MLSIIRFMLVITQVYQLHAYRILSVIPSASRSHHTPFQPLWRELALRGHEITVITTDPQRNSSVPNLKEIDISHCYEIYDKYKVMDTFINENMSYYEVAAVLGKAFTECNDYHLSLPEVQEMIHNKQVKFDLLMVEAQQPSMLAFAWRFKCPIIALASLEPAMQFHDSLGNIVHPLINPDSNLNIEDEKNMSFVDRLKSFWYTVLYKFFIYYKAYPKHHAHMQKYFGEDLPSLKELQDNISMMFAGTHPLFHNLRPINLNTIPIGSGMHIAPPKELPKNLKKFLDEAPNGVIYFSLGSNVNSNLLSDNFKTALIEAFAKIPYRVLLKMDADFSGVSKNVLVRKWMPQQDVLRHKNIKLFITQGGLQSLQESVVNGVPVIGIPFFGDQITNVNKMVSRGYGQKIDRRNITKEILVSTIEEVIKNPKYRETAKIMGEILRDEEIPSLQRAVYWTEYVIRHNGARHLRSPTSTMPTWKYYMLDVIGCLASGAVLFAVSIYFSIKMVIRLLIYVSRKCFPKKQKVKVKKVKKH